MTAHAGQHAGGGTPGDGRHAAGVALSAHDVGLVRADNPGPLTLSGTNTWLVGRDPCWIVDPGPALHDHLDAVAAEAGARGGAEGIVLTHGHDDHAGALPALARRLAAGHVAMIDGEQAGPLTALATPGHTPDHLAYRSGQVVFTGDAVPGEGSVFVAPDPGALRAHLGALERLRLLGSALLCPGHGPPVTDPRGRLDGLLAHRRERERALLAALEAGLRTVDELLDAAWADAPPALRLPATLSLAAHLDKLAEEDRLPAGVERPPWPPPGASEV